MKTLKQKGPHFAVQAFVSDERLSCALIAGLRKAGVIAIVIHDHSRAATAAKGGVGGVAVGGDADHGPTVPDVCQATQAFQVQRSL